MPGQGFDTVRPQDRFADAASTPVRDGKFNPTSHLQYWRRQDNASDFDNEENYG